MWTNRLQHPFTQCCLFVWLGEEVLHLSLSGVCETKRCGRCTSSPHLLRSFSAARDRTSTPLPLPPPCYYHRAQQAPACWVKRLLLYLKKKREMTSLLTSFTWKRQRCYATVQGSFCAVMSLVSRELSETLSKIDGKRVSGGRGKRRSHTCTWYLLSSHRGVPRYRSENADAVQMESDALGAYATSKQLTDCHNNVESLSPPKQNQWCIFFPSNIN